MSTRLKQIMHEYATNIYNMNYFNAHLNQWHALEQL